MDAEALSERVAESAEGLYWYQDAHPDLAESVVDVGCEVVGDYAVLRLQSRLGETTGMVLRVGSRDLREEEACFERYDEVTRTVIVRPGRDVLDEMEAGARVSIVSNMNFLVRAAGDFYRLYGDMLEVPRDPEDPVSPVFPGSGTPSAEQVSAAEGVCSSGMSYVWGAPGTGKTQFVLSSCIRGCLEAGMRVAVFAPTNNSVEQVLRGIIASFPDGSVPDGIMRLGIPTASFLMEHPGMCEDRQAQRRYDECMRAVSNLREALYERACDRVRGDIAALRSVPGGVWDSDDLGRRHPGLSGSFSRVAEVCRMSPSISRLADDCDEPLSSRLDAIEDALFRRERRASSISEYGGMSDSDIASEISAYLEQAEALRLSSTSARIESARIIAATPHQFISRFRPRGSPESDRMELDVDRIFLDEAGYCGLVQALALYTNGVPVAMFGDHMQLPPVEQTEDGVEVEWIRKRNSLQDVFLWNLSALYCEGLLAKGPDFLAEGYLANAPPQFEITSRHDLTDSHRFGPNLASVLDRLVYGNGLSGDGCVLEITVVDAQYADKVDRPNPAEAEAVRDFLAAEGPDPSEVCVLTPYKKQRGLLRQTVAKRYRDCVLTVHGSQGREWDTVILSVSDNRVPVRDVPYRFTSSSTPIGRCLMNTAVSRAKRRLVVVCDSEFWASREDELIGAVVREGMGASGRGE
ncbi:MAG: AAA domain-containing protein [Thermoplasmata archaeon]|nr:AAA domain-containing protein [Thermoplasmata archaeon]